MKVIYNNIIPFKGFAAINIFGVIFARRDIYISPKIINHEMIHTKQMKELGYVLFYVLYLFEWIVKLFIYGKNSYRNIPFECEAYKNELDLYYIKNRKHYSFLKFM